MARKPKDRILNLLENKPPEEAAVFPLIGFHSAVLFGVDPGKSVNDPEVMASVQKGTAEYYDVDGVTPVMDLSLEPEALGAKVRYFRGIPSVSEHLPLESWNILMNKAESYLYSGRIPVFLKAVKKLSESSADRLVCAYVSGPLTLATQAFGVEKVFLLARKKTPVFRDLLSTSTRLQLELVDAFCESGAECIIVLEPIGALIPSELFRDLLVVSLNLIASRARSRGVYSVLHVCGDSRRVFREMLITDVNALSVDKYLRLSEIASMVGDKVLMGNIGTTEMLLQSPEEISRQALDALEATGGKLILSTGCEVPPNTSQENIKALVKAAREFRLATQGRHYT